MAEGSTDKPLEEEPTPEADAVENRRDVAKVSPLLKGDRYSRDPVQHLRMWPHEHCEYWQEGDAVFLIGKTYSGDPWGAQFPKCPVCIPYKK